MANLMNGPVSNVYSERYVVTCMLSPDKPALSRESFDIIRRIVAKIG